MAFSLGTSSNNGPIAMQARSSYAIFSSRCHLEPSCGHLGLCWAILGPSWPNLGASGDNLGESRGHPGRSKIAFSLGTSSTNRPITMLARSSSAFFSSNCHLEPSWGHLGLSWAIWEPSWPNLGPSGGNLGESRGHPGSSKIGFSLGRCATTGKLAMLS